MYRRPRSFNLAPHANARHGQSADPYRGVYVQRPVEICSKGCAPVMMPSLPISRGEAYQPSSSPATMHHERCWPRYTQRLSPTQWHSQNCSLHFVAE